MFRSAIRTGTFAGYIGQRSNIILGAGQSMVCRPASVCNVRQITEHSKSVHEHTVDIGSLSSSSLPYTLSSSPATSSSPSLSNSSTAATFHLCSSQQSGNKDNDNSEGLAKVHQALAQCLPTFFQSIHDFRIYRQDVILEDNIRNVHTKGLREYSWQVAKIKLGAHLKYGKVQFQVLKITSHPENNTVRVRWRIVTVPGNNIVLAFWKFRIWQPKASIEEHRDEWIDGFSIFHCDHNGKVYKHVADKVIPDSNVVQDKDNRLAAGC